MRDKTRFFAPKNEPKIGFFECIEKFSHGYSWIFVDNESSYYMLYWSTNSIFGENLIPDIWAQILVANQIAEYLNQNMSLVQSDEMAQCR